MAKTLIEANQVNGGSTTTANTDGYWRLSGSLPATQSTTEANNDTRIRQAGVLDHLYCRVQTNSIASAGTTIKTRVNAVTGGQTLTIGSSATGEFEDTSGTDTIAAGDKVCTLFHPGAATGTMNIRIISALFNATTDTVTISAASGPFTVTTASTTWFHNLQGHAGGTTTTETFMKCRMRKSGTLKYLGVYVSANRATNSTVKLRKNGADATNLVTITGGGAAGWYEDTTPHSDTVTAGEDWNFSVTTGTGTDTLTIQTIKVEFVSTAGDGYTFCGSASGTGVADATSGFFPLGGNCDATTTESVAQSTPRVAFTLDQMEVMVSQNDVTSASTCDLRKGGVSQAVTVSITGSLTGLFADNTHSYTAATSDALCFRLSVPSVAGTHTVTLSNVGIHTHASNDYIRSIGTETVTSSESITRLLAATRTDTETTTVNETPTRMITAFRTIGTETVSLSESIARSKGFVRPIDAETITSSESTSRMLAATRNPQETTIISEVLVRMLAANRSIDVESVTSTDSVSRIRGVIRALAETVSSSDGLQRMLAATRAITESTTVSETVVRMLAAFRAISETVTSSDFVASLKTLIRTISESVTSSESISRMLGVSRSPSAESTTISDSVVRVRGLVRQLVESVTSGETLTRILAAIRTLTETTVITDLVSRVYTPGAGAFVRSMIETVTSSESITRMLAANRQLTESTSISDSVTRLLTLFRTLTETTTITDQVDRIRGIIRTISETVTSSDSVTRLLTAIRTLTETTSSSESTTRLLNANRSIQENTNTSDILNRMYVAFRTVAETVGITDAVDSIKAATHNFSVSIIETVTVMDAVFAYSLLQRFRGALNRYLKGEWSISDPTREDIS